MDTTKGMMEAKITNEVALASTMELKCSTSRYANTRPGRDKVARIIIDAVASKLKKYNHSQKDNVDTRVKTKLKRKHNSGARVSIKKLKIVIVVPQQSCAKQPIFLKQNKKENVNGKRKHHNVTTKSSSPVYNLLYWSSMTPERYPYAKGIVIVQLLEQCPVVMFWHKILVDKAIEVFFHTKDVVQLKANLYNAYIALRHFISECMELKSQEYKNLKQYRIARNNNLGSIRSRHFKATRRLSKITTLEGNNIWNILRKLKDFRDIEETYQN